MKGISEYKQVINFLSPIPEDEWTEFEKILYSRNLKKGEFLNLPGEIANEFCFIVHGLVKGFYTTEDGKKFIKDFADEGKLIGSYRSLLINLPIRLYVEAMEDTTMIAADYRKFEKQIMPRHRCWEKVSQKILEFQFLAREEREYQLLTMSVAERYQIILEQRPEIIERIPQYDLASFLGTDPAVLSRIKKKLS